MKLEPLFTVKENKLYKIEDNTTVELSELKFIDVAWSTVELEDEAYNEEYLAQLRDELKALETTGKFAVIAPVVDKAFETPEQIELYINAFNHTARRIKDCVSVVGFTLPEAVCAKGFEPGTPAGNFMDTLAIKHAQYVYFAKTGSAPADKIVLY